MKQLKHSIFSVLFLSITLLSSCNNILDDEQIIAEHEQMEVGFTRASLNSLSTSGHLIFWINTIEDPYFTSIIDNLNAYSDNKYNTGELYPSNNTTVYATGFSPADMQQSNNNKRLTLSTRTSGLTDVCIASSIINGNRITPFNAPMSFEHTLTKIRFTVERDMTMVGIRDVRNITVTIPNSYLPIEWNWNEVAYQVNYSKPATDNLTLTHPDIISGTTTDELETVYLMLPTNNLGILNKIRLTADILLTTSSEVERSIDNTLDIQLYDTDNATMVTNAKPGEAYEINIRFQQNSFTLIARQLDNWEQGGLIYVPVKP